MAHHLPLSSRLDDSAALEALRAPAAELWRQKAAKSAESQALYQRGDKAGARVASEAAHALEQRARLADGEAAARIFERKQLGLRSDEVDLHGLHVEEAKEHLAARLAGERGGHLVVIYGQGHHSKDHRAHLKPAVLALLAGRGLAVREGWHGGLGHANEGVCTVALTHAGALAPSTPAFDAGLRIKLPGDRGSQAARGSQADRQPRVLQPAEEPVCCAVM
jgi:DNA-nicking Smr family endonuclease